MVEIGIRDRCLASFGFFLVPIVTFQLVSLNRRGGEPGGAVEIGVVAGG